MFSLESPQRGDSNEYTKYTISRYKKEIILNHTKSATIEFVPRDPGTSSEIAMVNEQSVFEPLKFYCTYAFALIFLICPSDDSRRH